MGFLPTTASPSTLGGTWKSLLTAHTKRNPARTARTKRLLVSLSLSPLFSAKLKPTPSKLEMTITVDHLKSQAVSVRLHMIKEYFNARRSHARYGLIRDVDHFCNARILSTSISSYLVGISMASTVTSVPAYRPLRLSRKTSRSADLAIF